jgi:hypothetical protein
MFIKYSGTNVHAMAQINETALKAMKKGAKTAVIQTPQDVKWLRPGWNEFPKAVWEQNKNHPEILKMLKKGKIELFSAKAKVKVKDARGKIKIVERMVGMDDRPIRLRWFDEKLAMKLARETLNRDILQRWIDEETRHRVKKVLRKQIEPLLPSKEDDEDSDDWEDEEYE